MNELSNLAEQLAGAAVKRLKNPLLDALHEELKPQLRNALDEVFDGPMSDRLQSGVAVTRRVIQRARRKMQEGQGS